jgi:hypothetical protein
MVLTDCKQKGRRYKNKLEACYIVLPWWNSFCNLRKLTLLWGYHMPYRGSTQKPIWHINTGNKTQGSRIRIKGLFLLFCESDPFYKDL